MEEKVFKVSGLTKLVVALGTLLALGAVVVFINTCIEPDKNGNKLFCIIFFGAIMLFFLWLAFLGILELKDYVILKKDGIKFHLHRQSAPYSLKPIDDELAWKDIKEISIVAREKTTFLVMELLSGEVKEFGIGHLEKRLPLDINFYFSPDTDADVDEAQLEAEEEEDEEMDPNLPGSLDGSKKRKFHQVLLCALAELIGIALLAAKQRWGFVLVFIALFYGCGAIYKYYVFNSLHLDPEKSKKGRKTLALSALLLVALLVASFFVADVSFPPAN